VVEAMPNFYNLIRAKKFSTSSDNAIEIGPSSSATPNFAIDAGGKIKWSSGSGNSDTNIYRSSAGVLKTDNSLTITGTTTLQQSLEQASLSSTALTGTVNIDMLSGAVYYYTSNSSGNFTFNIRGNSSNTLDSLMSTGQSLTVVLFCTNSTARNLSSVTIDTNATVSTKWFGGSAPSGNANSVDVYTLTIIKTATSTFTVFASQSKFA
jgi:hypothetical protein